MIGQILYSLGIAALFLILGVGMRRFNRADRRRMQADLSVLRKNVELAQQKSRDELKHLESLDSAVDKAIKQATIQPQMQREMQREMQMLFATLVTLMKASGIVEVCVSPEEYNEAIRVPLAWHADQQGLHTVLDPAKISKYIVDEVEKWLREK